MTSVAGTSDTPSEAGLFRRDSLSRNRRWKINPMVMTIVVLGTIVYGYRLGAKDFWSSGEGQSAVIAREMLASGDWLAPRASADSVIHAPLYYWLVAASQWLTGSASESTARFPASLAAIATVVLIYFLGRRMRGERAGRMAAAATGLCSLFVWQARLAELDMLLCFWVVLAYWAWFRAMHGSDGYFVLLHLAVGGASMTKGLAGMVLIGLPLLVFLIWDRQWKCIARRGFWFALPLSMAALLWHVNLLQASPPVANDGFFTGLQEIGHGESWSYYVTRLPLAFLPMTLILPWAVLLPWRPAARPERRAEQAKSCIRLAYCWFFVSFALFTLWPEKQTSNLVPLLPALGLLTAMVFEVKVAEHGFWSVNLRDTFAKVSAWLIPAVCAVAGPIVALLGYGDAGWLLFATAAVMTMISLAARISAGWRRRFGVQIGLIEFIVVLLVVCGHIVPRLNYEESHRPFLAKVQRMVPSDEALVGVHLRPHDLFYLHRPVRVVKSRDNWMNESKSLPYVIVGQRNLNRLPSEAYTPLLRSEEVSRNDDLALVQLHAPR